MRSIYCIQCFCIVLFSATGVFAQREGHMWLFGNYTGLDFNSGVAVPVSSKVLGYPLAPKLHNSTLSDSSGHLRYYENNLPPGYGAIGIHDRLDSLIMGPILTSSNTFYVDGRYDTRFLPFRGTDKIAYVYIDIYPPRSTLNYIMLSDTMRDGLGGVWDDSVRVVSRDSLTPIGLGCVRHANGRDWWVVAHEFLSDTFITALFTPDTAYVVHKQQIGTYQGIYHASPTSGGGVGVIRFSPTGNKLLRANGERLIELYDFDRCTGLLSNLNIISPPSATFGHNDAEFSPNEKFIYVTTVDSLGPGPKYGPRIYQFEIEEPDSNLRRVIIDSFPAVTGQMIGMFHYLSLGHDNKIYVSLIPKDSFYLSVIQEPDVKGTACNFQRSGLYMGGMKTIATSLPQHPSYTIGPIDGSLCDTLGLDAYPPIVYSSNKSMGGTDFIIYPNPADAYCIISGTALPEVLRASLYDIQGRTHKLPVLPLSALQKQLDLRNFPPGMYVLEIETSKGMYRHKIRIER